MTNRHCCQIKEEPRRLDLPVGTKRPAAKHNTNSLAAVLSLPYFYHIEICWTIDKPLSNALSDLEFAHSELFHLKSIQTNTRYETLLLLVRRRRLLEMTCLMNQIIWK